MSRKLQKSNEYSFVFNNLIDICARRKITVTSLIEKYQSSSALQAWKNGKINAEIIPNLAFDLGVSIEYLLTGEEKSPSLPDDELELLTYYKKIPEKEKIKLISRAETIADIYKEQVKEQTDRKMLITVTTTLKVYSMAAGAGVSIPFSEDDDYTIMQFPQFDVPTNATCGIYISGESMEPKYPNGCLVWVKETQDVNYGDVVIAIVNGEPFCKIYQPDGLYSINENYSPILVTEYDNFSMFGKVLGYYVE